MPDTFEYYMIRLRRTDAHPEQVIGQVERLGTGEKLAFGSGEHLVRLVTAWRTGGDEPPPAHTGLATARADEPP
jgi:hypothetical protein